MRLYTGIFAIILIVMLWSMDSAAAFKCDDSKFESFLAGYLGKGSVQLGPSMCMYRGVNIKVQFF